MMLLKYTAVVIITPIFFFPGVLVAILGAACGQVYIVSMKGNAVIDQG